MLHDDLPLLNALGAGGGYVVRANDLQRTVAAESCQTGHAVQADGNNGHDIAEPV